MPGNMKSIFYFVLVSLVFSGCTILGNLDEISTLSDYSSDKDAQHRLVKSINARYDALVAAIDKGLIGDHKDEASFVQGFGEPIFKKNLSGGMQRWLYRYAVYKYAKTKVYVYFDATGHMIKWEKLPCPKLF
jgi:hypothetical protein